MAIEILFAISAITVMAVYNLSVLGSFRDDIELRFAPFLEPRVYAVLIYAAPGVPSRLLL